LELGAFLNFRFTSVLSIIADLVTVCVFLFSTAFIGMGVNIMGLITIFVLWCGMGLWVLLVGMNTVDKVKLASQ